MNTKTQAMLETVENIFNSAHSIVEGMADGERMQIKELTQAVGLALAMDPKQILNFVNYYAHNTDLGYVSRGKNGGLIRGVKQVKAPKVKRVKAKTLPAAVVDDADISN